MAAFSLILLLRTLLELGDKLVMIGTREQLRAVEGSDNLMDQIKKD